MERQQGPALSSCLVLRNISCKNKWNKWTRKSYFAVYENVKRLL